MTADHDLHAVPEDDELGYFVVRQGDLTLVAKLYLTSEPVGLSDRYTHVFIDTTSGAPITRARSDDAAFAADLRQLGVDVGRKMAAAADELGPFGVHGGSLR